MKSGRYTLNTVTGGTTEPQTQSLCQDEGKARVCRGSRCLVLMTVCLGLICVLLLVSIILQHISITAERESLFKSYKNTVEELNQTINRLQHNYTDLMTEKDQLKNNFNSLSQKKLELETRVSNLTAEKSQLQKSVDSLGQKKLELETKTTSLSEELEKEKSKGNLCGPVCLFKSNESKSWSESRQYCRDRGADLVIINTEEKQRSISSFIKERVWIGLSDIENEGNMTWVDNSTLKQGLFRFWYGGEPNNAGGDEDCVELMPLNTINNWNDLPCSEKRKGICYCFLIYRGSRCLVMLTVCLGLICALLLVSIILQYISITAERESLFKSYKNTAEEFNQSINILQDNYTDLMTEKDQQKNKTRDNYTDLMIEKDQLQDIFNFVIQKKLELENRVDNLTTEKSQLQGNIDFLSQKKLELETRFFFSTSSVSKSWSESRQYCRDHGGDLAIIDTEEKQRHISSFITEPVWIGLTDIENEGTWKWVDNSPLNRGFWFTGEPNSFHGTNEDCVELMPTRDNVNNWNDLSCTDTRKWEEVGVW
ncbi:uncharacterized protein LOC127512338 [Ctenopharyngodon idella]|uniref:uncharacterized protein LOC127512338 n=1 Tax=Ctenopharyngodon idella TaxID=7959 RepID=UPI00222EFD60|nr:uncharacterized protein LOC127512338 [Ctenopharyngodon idella]